MSGMGSKWVQKFMWGQFGLIPPDDNGHEKDAADWLEHASRTEDAKFIVALFNACLENNRKLTFVPMISAAIDAKHPWLILLCTGCNTTIDLDLRVKPRPPEATLGMAVRDVKCSRCNGQSWLQILRLSQSFTPTAAKPPHMPPDPSRPW